jgi:hypothetical protein
MLKRVTWWMKTDSKRFALRVVRYSPKIVQASCKLNLLLAVQKLSDGLRTCLKYELSCLKPSQVSKK